MKPTLYREQSYTILPIAISEKPFSGNVLESISIAKDDSGHYEPILEAFLYEVKRGPLKGRTIPFCVGSDALGKEVAQAVNALIERNIEENISRVIESDFDSATHEMNDWFVEHWKELCVVVAAGTLVASGVGLRFYNRGERKERDQRVALEKKIESETRTRNRGEVLDEQTKRKMLESSDRVEKLSIVLKLYPANRETVINRVNRLTADDYSAIQLIAENGNFDKQFIVTDVVGALALIKVVENRGHKQMDWYLGILDDLKNNPNGGLKLKANQWTE